MPDQNLQQFDAFFDELKKSYGKLSALVVALAGGVLAVVSLVETKPWHVSAIVVIVLSIFAIFAWWLYRRQQKTARLNQPENISGAAFRGLSYFEEGDSETFFGRETDIGEILLKVRSSEFRFGVLTGESGCGKTSLLRAGLIPKLQEANYLPVYLRLYGDPETLIRQALSIKTGVSSVAGEDLPTYLQQICETKQQTLVLICDQFEEFFINHPDTTARQPFIDFVAHCYHNQNLAVKFLFSLREDFLIKINEFDGEISEPLAENKRYHLKNFDRNQAESIIQRSVDKAGLPFEFGLSNTIAEDLVKDNHVLPAELQIVCQQLQRQRIYSTDQYTVSGGKESLVYAFLEREIKFAGIEKDVKLVLHSMISEEGTKLTQTLADIARNSQQSEKQVESILHHFVTARLIREIQDQTPWHYELMHEYLIAKINAISSGVVGTSQRANRIFKQWLNRYQLDNKTLISFEDSRFIQRYSDMERNGTAKELLAKSLRRGWINVGVMIFSVLGAVSFAGWYFWTEIDLRDRNKGVLVINNSVGAQLTLQRVRHYRKKANKRETIPLNDIEVYLEGPADYILSAEIKDTRMAYPVFIEGYNYTANITIEQLPDLADIPKDMAYIPVGMFRMGDKNAKDGLDGNAPAHDVYLDAFLIDITEVSNRNFREFIVAKGYETESLWKYKNGSSKAGIEYLSGMEMPKQPRYWNDKEYNQVDHPVVGVSWFEARAYCRWNGKELPTEAQWEKAARGPEGYEWSFGNVWDDTKVNGSGEKDGYAYTAPVSAYQANSYGLYNMSGNVREWVQDAYQADFHTTTKGKEANPVNDVVGLRVWRGGSWNYSFALNLRASDRFWNYPNYRDNYIGFRCARTL